MEDKCHFVCSRGLLKSCDFHSLNPISSCGNDIGYLIEMLNSTRMYDGMTIYVCSDLLRSFVKYVLPKITHKFVLVSGDSDMTVPYEAMTEPDATLLFANAFMIRWYAQNTIHPRILPLPIGLDYHTIANNPNHYWRQSGEPFLPLDQEKILFQIRDDATPRCRDTILANFTLGNDRFGQRAAALSNINRQLLNIRQEILPRTELWKLMRRHTFVLSPFGMGMDCHRTWEALCLGCIPIVMTNALSRIFDDLPILIVDDWSLITEQLLVDTLTDFKIRTFELDKMKMSYWLEKIRA
jgi:hypothetical protein